MAGRGRQPFVYVIKAGEVPVYVGKGTGRRHKQSALRYGGEACILEWCATDDEAFARERHWIEELKPTENKCPGGNGGRAAARSRFDVPKALQGLVSKADWRRLISEQDAEQAEMQRVGPRRYVAQFLCRKLSEANCEAWGVSKVDLSRLREVAYG